MLKGMIAKHTAEREILDEIRRNIVEDDFDIMDAKGLTGESEDARLVELESRSTANVELAKKITSAQAFAKSEGSPAFESPSVVAKVATPRDNVAGPITISNAKREFGRLVYNNPSFQARKEAGGKFHISLESAESFELMRTTFVAVASGNNFVDGIDRIGNMRSELGALALFTFRPVAGEVMRFRRVTTSTVVSPTAPDTASETTAVITEDTEQVRKVNASIPISRHVVEDDMSSVDQIVEDLIYSYGVQILTGILQGDNTGEQWNGLETQFTGTNTEAVTAGEHILLGTNEGLELLMGTVASRGSMPDTILLNYPTAVKCYQANRLNNFALSDFTSFPFGGVMGARAFPTSYMGSNVGIIGNFQQERIYIGMARTMEIMSSTEEEFSLDNVVYRISGRGNVALRHPNSFLELTATNEYDTTTP